MSADHFDDVITAQARALGLTIDPAWRENIAFFLSVAEGMAALVLETGAAASTEAAPVFTAEPPAVPRSEVSE